MKIDEPKTPFEAYESDGEDGKEELDANLLAARISAEGHKGPRPRRYVWSSYFVGLVLLMTCCTKDIRAKWGRWGHIFALSRGKGEEKELWEQKKETL